MNSQHVAKFNKSNNICRSLVKMCNRIFVRSRHSVSIANESNYATQNVLEEKCVVAKMYILKWRYGQSMNCERFYDINVK